MQNEPELVEIAARVLAPFMEGGREFDQMPPDRIALRKWCREGMCSTNDATQDDALEAATAVLAAVTPQIEAHAREEGAKAMQWPDQWPLGTRVRKRKGSSWQGRVVGYYITNLTPRGYAVESEREPGSVQIYPEAAFEVIDPAQIAQEPKP